MKEVALSKFSKPEEDLAKGRGPSRVREQLKYRQEGSNVKSLLQMMDGPLLLALRLGEVYWSLSEAGHVQAAEGKCLWFVCDSHPYACPRGSGALSDLGAGTVCLEIILYSSIATEIPGSSSALTQMRAKAPWAG